MHFDVTTQASITPMQSLNAMPEIMLSGAYLILYRSSMMRVGLPFRSPEGNFIMLSIEATTSS